MISQITILHDAYSNQLRYTLNCEQFPCGWQKHLSTLLGPFLFCPLLSVLHTMAFKCRKMCIIFLFSLSENGKRSKKSISLSVSDPHSQLRHYFQVELASSASWASMVWYSVMQQVFFLFHSFSPSLSLSLSFSCTNRGTGDFLLIVIRQSAVYEGQYFEGGHERNKPIRGER